MEVGPAALAGEHITDLVGATDREVDVAGHLGNAEDAVGHRNGL